jgi:uncharacterized protein YbcI
MANVLPSDDGGVNATLQQVAQDFASVYAERLERTSRGFCATLLRDELCLRLEGVLTEGERALLAYPDGASAIQADMRRQMDLLYPWLADQVEQRLHCQVAESHLDLDFDDGSLVCTVSLRDLPRTWIIQPSA